MLTAMLILSVQWVDGSTISVRHPHNIRARWKRIPPISLAPLFACEVAVKFDHGVQRLWPSKQQLQKASVHSRVYIDTRFLCINTLGQFLNNTPSPSMLLSTTP